MFGLSALSGERGGWRDGGGGASRGGDRRRSPRASSRCHGAACRRSCGMRSAISEARPPSVSTCSSVSASRGSIVSGDVVEFGTRIGVPRAIVERYQHRDGGVVMLVLDVADDLLDEILDRDRAPRCPNIRRRRSRGACAWRASRRAGRSPPSPRARKAARGSTSVILSGRGAAPARYREDVLDVDHPDHRIERLAVDGQAAEWPASTNSATEFVDGRILVDRDDVAARGPRRRGRCARRNPAGS